MLVSLIAFGLVLILISGTLLISELVQREPRSSRFNFQELLEGAPDAMIVIDDRGLINVINKQVENLFRYGREEVLGKSVNELIPDFFGADKFTSRLEGCSNRRDEALFSEHHVWGLRKDGARFPVEINISPLKMPANDRGIAVLAIRDIAKYREAQLEIKKLQDEMEEKISKRTEELEAFSYAISHDLREPLRSIDGFSRAFMEEYADKLTKEGKDYIARVREGTARMKELIEAMLGMARFVSKDVARERVDLTFMANQIATDLLQTHPQRTVEFAIENEMVANGDPILIRALLENLIGNAWKFTSRHPAARIELVVEKGSSEENLFFVRDNGVGFDMSCADQLFGVFRRLHGDADFPGVGIGLATVKRIVQRHGGTIRAESGPGQGATFYFGFGPTKKRNQESSARSGKLSGRDASG